ncbi:large ribosomal subunit protein mL102 (rPPR5) [Gastrolobium bilobum]|uniref:large ribosomal subunit protein mL102 (rPPR5) n=1 Tax=Gastrolobium bilobum TaxID=150636 RepID=UPI002AAF5C27|nr:large ribosomal subunit protein mL102 (rPPR5) [Gastrolobium bilobum]XP_061373797.1 large ribosomal subunit protein mL102 (rPPR5) [Gastrolobium bilobum]XP_061373798.1 large ribosomal subunit protein mL102 (rPPR5) [Gastrolobium bilobum]XP_061373799.1 large ribosomal subunit protein mL102 (rPPR5) [Gastrolobium bilobum]XP_061373800.1 large ribosomal subunit protein mL102 (rPPR5) [Gastrolobium bilobum]
MSFLSNSKLLRWKPSLHPFIPKPSLPFSASTAEHLSDPDPDPRETTISTQEKKPPLPEPEKRTVSNKDKLEVVICRMMANRAWTTRLQNSIRSMVPRFDPSLVWNVLHGAKSPEHALQFYRWVERAGLFNHDRDTTLKMIQILGRYSKLNHARCIVLDMPKKGVALDEDVFVALIDGYGRAGIVQEAVKIFQKMKELGVERTVKSYDALFKVILRRGRYMMAKRYYNSMLREEGVEPTRHTYNILLWGMFLSLRLDTAIRLYEDMKSRDILPDVVTYNTLINGYYRFKKVEEAEKLFVEMKGRNIAPNVISYTTMLKGYVAVGQIDGALKVFEEMKSCGIKPNAVTFSTLLPGLCDADKMAEARNVLGEMVERYIAPKDNAIFMKLLNCQCKSGDLDAAADVLKAMIRLSIPTEAGHYGVLIENFCKANVYDKAEKLLDKLIEKGIILRPHNSFEIEPSAYNPMIQYLCDNGQTVKAETFFRQLMKKGVQDSVAFNNLIRGHSKEGKPDSAFEIIKIMCRRGVPRDADSYKLLIESYLRKGEPADTKTALDSMLESGHLPESSLYRSIIESLFEDGRVQTASRVMKSMVEKGVKENMDLVSKILEALLMRGHVEEALGRIDLLMLNGCEPDLDHLLSILCEKEKTIAALKLLDFVLERECIISFPIYDKVLDALLAAGKTLNAYSILCKILEKRGATDWNSRDELIKSLNQEGNTKQADVLSRMIKGKEGSPLKREGKKKATGAT